MRGKNETCSMGGAKDRTLGPLVGGQTKRRLMGDAKDITITSPCEKEKWEAWETEQLGRLMGGRNGRHLMGDPKDRMLRTPHGRQKREAPNGRPER
jgi:hypothetical protein